MLIILILLIMLTSTLCADTASRATPIAVSAPGQVAAETEVGSKQERVMCHMSAYFRHYISGTYGDHLYNLCVL